MNKIVLMDENGKKIASMDTRATSMSDIADLTECVAFKIWKKEDILTVAAEEGYDEVEDVADAIIEQMEQDGSIDILSDCTDNEWNAIRAAVRAVKEKYGD